MIHVWAPADILVSAFLIRLVINILDKRNGIQNKHIPVIFFAVLIWHVGLMLLTSYGALGFMFGVCGYLKMKEEKSGIHNKFLPVIILITLALDYFFQIATSENSVYYWHIFGIVSCIQFFIFNRFKMKTFPEMQNKTLNTIVMFFSRNSLFVYWFHFMLFVTIAAILYPHREF
jgi:hypothetical protein